jgi:hypothetical protein
VNQEAYEMRREVDLRTGRPLVNGRDHIEALTDEELEAELTIAAANASRRGERLQNLLLERTRRRYRRTSVS